jgi:transposase InsO family protein
MMQERAKGRTQQQAAAKANVNNRKTVAKYEKAGQLPSQLKQPRRYRTREDPFAEDWPKLEEMLTAAPELEAAALFEWLCDQHTDESGDQSKYQEGQLRTLQRRVSTWKALHQDKLAVLEQAHRPGEALQTDGTWLTELGVTIQGEPFKHILIHCVLPYSNWSWGVIAQSESQLALRRGLQATLFQLGHVPEYHQTDNSSAATYQVRVGPSGERDYTPGYLALLAHFGLKPRLIQVGSPEQNGDIEAANGALKRSLKQQLLLRGSRNFDSQAEYEQFLAEVMSRRNARQQARLNEELAVMTPLTAGALGSYQEVRVKVNRSGLIRVQNNAYSVPTGLIGRQVTVRLHEWQIEVWLGQHHVETMPRLVGQNKQQINYRHIIDSLLRKPGAFRNYRYREALFPTLVFRQAWEQLQQWHSPRKADLIYLRLLRLAARTMECEVEAVLKRLMVARQRWDDRDVEPWLALPPPTTAPALAAPIIDLGHYDQLLTEARDVAA